MIEAFDMFIGYSMVVGALVGRALFGLLAIGFLMALAGVAVMACAGLTASANSLLQEWLANRRGEVK